MDLPMHSQGNTRSADAVSALSAVMMREIRARHRANLAASAARTDPLARLDGSLAVHCRVDLASRTVVESASMATLFKGYEALLPGRDLGKIGQISAAASGICGGVHATASALCLEMALGLTPPPLGIILRNLLLSCQYLNDTCLHLFVLAGPDYSRQAFEQTNPEIWSRAVKAPCRHTQQHGFTRIGELMAALDQGEGALYKEALRMAARARQAYTLLGGKYPHSESIVPGGVALCADTVKLAEFNAVLQPFAAYSQKTAAVWDDMFDFLLEAEPRYAELGQTSAAMLDFGQWDHPDHYDGSYARCDSWGARRWSTPGALMDGRLACTALSLLNAGMEEHLDHSYQQRATAPRTMFTSDPNGNPISRFHPWNKRTEPTKANNPRAYSWGSSLVWRGHNFEVGAYARLYLSAVAQLLPPSKHVVADGTGLDFSLADDSGNEITLRWSIPALWNAFERNRARAYSLAFNVGVTRENMTLAEAAMAAGATTTRVPLNDVPTGRHLGVGLWGASRGFLAHWAVLDEQKIDNYQIAIPSRINVGTRTPDCTPGPLEQALCNTPIIESRYKGPDDFVGIDIQRAIQSFDPCMDCTAYILINDGATVLERTVDTRVR
ncbi:cytochrome C [Dyella sp. M7H15-1]|uniref:nickel-dependent hydrogenase large subunit n=1 Tax=Dyella sp. M7H15-1 TaxID=2501295 RepID=UPI001004E85B|nr:nickel-dependent hydrogenase large subunit [Dyella sp. M7H15-1]QAU23163.1 cytochrome C [Dyella sp. M7H15-1]